jgi:hypothetical protein
MGRVVSEMKHEDRRVATDRQDLPIVSAFYTLCAQNALTFNKTRKPEVLQMTFDKSGPNHFRRFHNPAERVK